MYKPNLLEASRKRARERHRFFYTGTCRDCRKRTGNKCGHWHMVCMTVCVRVPLSYSMNSGDIHTLCNQYVYTYPVSVITCTYLGERRQPT